MRLAARLPPWRPPADRWAARVAHRRGRADALDLDIDPAGEDGGAGRDDHLVVAGPQRHERRAVRHLSAGTGVQPGEQVTGRVELPAGGRALAGEQRAETGQLGAVLRRAQGDHPPDGGVTVLAEPQPGHHAAGRVAHHVHRGGAGTVERGPGGGGQHPRLGGQVTLGVAGQGDDLGVLAVLAQPGGQHAETAGRAAVAGHQQHRAGQVRRHRPRGTPAATTGQRRDDPGDQRDQDGGAAADHQAATSRGQRAEHRFIVGPSFVVGRPRCGAACERSGHLPRHNEMAVSGQIPCRPGQARGSMGSCKPG